METNPEFLLEDIDGWERNERVKWEKMLDLIAEILEIPAALVMRAHKDSFQVLACSSNPENTFQKGDDVKRIGSYCETVLKYERELVVSNAPASPEWKNSPPVSGGWVSYMGYPIRLPSGEMFGTICVMDTKQRNFLKWNKKLLSIYAGSIEDNLAALKTRMQLNEQIDNFALSQKSLHQSEERFKQVFKSSPIANLLTAFDGTILDANQRYMDLTGYSYDELIGRSGIELNIYMNPADRAFVLQKLQNDKAVCNHYIMLRSKKGECRHCLGSVEKIWVLNEPCLLSTLYDITSVTKLENELIKMNERYSLAARVAEFGVWDWDIPNNVLVWDDQMYSLYGMNREDFFGAYEAWIACLHPEDRDRCQAEWLGARNSGKQYDSEFRIICPDGSIKFIKALGEVSYSEQGDPMRMIGLNFNISNIRKLEAEVVESEKKYRDLFCQSTAIQIIIDVETGAIHDVNPAGVLFYGYKKEDLVGRHMTFLNGMTMHTFNQKMHDSYNRKKNHYEVTHRLANGETRLMESFNAPVVIYGHKYIHSILHDITHKKQAESELLLLNEELVKKELFNKAVMDNLPIGIAVNTVDPVDFKYMNDLFPNIYRTSRQALLDPDTFWDTVYEDPAFRKEIKKRVTDGIGSGDPAKMRWENIPIIRQGEKTRYVTAQNTFVPGENMMISTVMDVTERMKAEENLKYLSYHDHLTDLYNRRFFEGELKRLDAVNNLPVTVIMGDVNGLKLINDSFGHEMGDTLLKSTAQIFKAACRPDDIIARVGGDEFAVILPKTGGEGAEEIMDRIKQKSFLEMDHTLLSVSVGAATKYSKSQKMKEVLAEAENLMYQRKMYESASLRNKTVGVIMNALFEKSQRELRHSQRVSEISAAIATEMKLSADEINRIRISGLVHDIGKIGINEKVLNKPEKLTDEEWLEIKRHPEAGWRILSSANEFSDMAKHILLHHERWDGRGYPKGLRGEEITIEARIISLADSYDAMTQDRPYRHAMTKEEAMEEIKKNAGLQYDPRIAEIFLNHVLPKYIKL